MWLRNLGKSILIALVPGAVLPVIFFVLFSFNTAATRRDVLPGLDNPLEIIGFAGSVIFSAPIFLFFVSLAAIVNTIHEHGFIIPIYDSLSRETQSAIFLTFCLASNVLLWTIPVSFFRWIRKYLTPLSTTSQNNVA